MQPQDGVPSFETPTPFTFLATQLQILQDALEDVKKLDSKKERNQKIKIVRNQILELPESQTLDTNGREDLRAAIATWFSLRSKRQTQKIKFGKTWNARLVLYEENKDEVLAMQARLYQKAEKKGENPKRNFDFLQRAISKVWKRQSKEDRKALQKLAKRWNNEGAPRAQKQTAATKNTWKYTKKFAEDMYKSLGVRFLFLVALETPAGLVNTGMMDFNDSLGGGATYMAKHGNWKTEGFDMDSWNNHNRDYYNSEQNPVISMTKVPRSLMQLDRNEFGEPILPDPLFVPSRETGRTWRQALVRAFMTYHYVLASGAEGAIPWKKLVPRLRECVEEEHLPSHLLSLIGEPSTMKDDHCHSLLTFWYRRQTNGMVPSFRFNRYMMKDDLVEGLPRELVDIPIPETDATPIATGSNIAPTATPPIASGSSAGANAPGTGTHSNKNGKAKRPRGSGKINKGKGKARAAFVNGDESSANSPYNSDPQSTAIKNARGTRRQSKRTHKSGEGKGGAGTAKAISSNHDESTADFTSHSDSESESTTTSGNMTDSTDSDSEDQHSRGPTQTFPRNSTQVLSNSTQVLYSPTVHQSHEDVDPIPTPDTPSEDENMFPSPILDLCPELQRIEKMVEAGIPRDKVLQAFSALTMRSQSGSPVKASSRGLSSNTDHRKGSGRPIENSGEAIENSVEANPPLPTISPPNSLHSPPLTHQPSLAIAPEASSSSAARGPDARTTQGGGLRGKGSRKKTDVPSQRVTRSNAPKKRSTRAHPN